MADSSVTSMLTRSSKKSKAMIVGTYRDKVTKEEFERKDRLLQSRIENTEFYQKIIEYALEDQLMIAANNMDGGQDEIDKNRTILKDTIERCFDKVTIPASWLAFSLYIRSLESRSFSLEQCERLASKVGINKEELQHALWFLHNIGVLLYFSEVKALKKPVIRDMQVVFDSMTALIKDTFTFKKVGQRQCKEFKKTGRFSLEDVRKVAISKEEDLIQLDELIELLKHLNILGFIPSHKSTKDPTYFMPCVLQSKRPSEMDTPVSTKQDPAPLIIRYNCGYTPVGLFPSMIASLVSKPPEGWEIIWEGLYKNRVQFRVGIEKDCDTLTLLLHPRFIEIALSRNHSSKFRVSTEKVCGDLHSVITSTLRNVTSRMSNNFKMGYKFGFQCPAHPEEQHLSVMSNETASKMKCLQNTAVVEMKPNHLIWFSAIHSTATGKTEAHLTMNNFHILYKTLYSAAAKWEDIGLFLELDPSDLDIIDSDKSNSHAKLKGMLKLWLKQVKPLPTKSKMVEVLKELKFTQEANKLEEQ